MTMQETLDSIFGNQKILGFDVGSSSQIFQEPKVLQETKVLEVKVLTMTKKLANQLDIIWSPTKMLLDNSKILGRVRASALDKGTTGTFLLVDVPEDVDTAARLALVKVHYQESFLHQWPLIVLR